jgi:hypothetical protein
MSVIGQDDVGSRKEENAYEFSHFESLKTCGYDRRNGEKRAGSTPTTRVFGGDPC